MLRASTARSRASRGPTGDGSVRPRRDAGAAVGCRWEAPDEVRGPVGGRPSAGADPPEGGRGGRLIYLLRCWPGGVRCVEAWAGSPRFCFHRPDRCDQRPTRPWRDEGGGRQVDDELSDLLASTVGSPRARARGRRAASDHGPGRGGPRRRRRPRRHRRGHPRRLGRARRARPHARAALHPRGLEPRRRATAADAAALRARRGRDGQRPDRRPGARASARDGPAGVGRRRRLRPRGRRPARGRAALLVRRGRAGPHRLRMGQRRPPPTATPGCRAAPSGSPAAAAASRGRKKVATS